MGQPEMFRNTFVHLAKELNIFIVSVDYRLAPEFKYPTPLDDCVSTTVMLIKDAKNFGVDPERIAIGGDSAGGNLAAAVALKLHNDAKYADLPKLKLVALFYPVLQSFDFNLPSYQQNRFDPCLTPSEMIWFWSLYLNGKMEYLKEALVNNHTNVALHQKLSSKVDWELIPANYRKGFTKKVAIGDKEAVKAFQASFSDPYIAPLIASDIQLKNYPPTYLLTCEFDVLRDEGLILKQRLLNLGVPVTHLNSRFYHAVFSMFDMGIGESVEAVNHFINFWKNNVSLL